MTSESSPAVHRTAEIRRETRETTIEVSLDVVGLVVLAELPLTTPEWPRPFAVPTLPVPDDILHVPRLPRG